MNKPLAVVSHLYIYPVKAMRGILLPEAFLGINGFYGDRRYAFVRRDLLGANGFPWMSARLKPRLILYTPKLLSAPMPDYDPRSRSFGSTLVQVVTPHGGVYMIHDSRLCEELAHVQGEPLSLMQSHRGVYDSQQLSLFSLATVQELENESNVEIDHRQFRANVYFQPARETAPFIENDWVGRVLRIGPDALIGVTEKNERCLVVNLDPHSAVQSPRILRSIAQKHNEEAGIYANVLRSGRIRIGDVIEFE